MKEHLDGTLLRRAVRFESLPWNSAHLACDGGVVVSALEQVDDSEHNDSLLVETQLHSYVIRVASNDQISSRDISYKYMKSLSANKRLLYLEPNMNSSQVKNNKNNDKDTYKYSITCNIHKNVYMCARKSRKQ